MLLIPVYLAPSAIHGLGVFAEESVSAGTPVWRFQSGFDVAYDAEEFTALPDSAQSFLRSYGYFDNFSQCFVLNGDHGRFMNHSEAPNTGALGSSSGGSREELVTVALKDIPKGAEITCDYRAFDGEVLWKLRHQIIRTG